MSSEKQDRDFDLQRKYEDRYSPSYMTKKGIKHRIRKTLNSLEKEFGGKNGS